MIIERYVALTAGMVAAQMAEPRPMKKEEPLPKHNSGCGSSNNNRSGRWSEHRRRKEIKRRRKQKRLKRKEQHGDRVQEV